MKPAGRVQKTAQLRFPASKSMTGALEYWLLGPSGRNWSQRVLKGSEEDLKLMHAQRVQLPSI